MDCALTLFGQTGELFITELTDGLIVSYNAGVNHRPLYVLLLFCNDPIVAYM